MSSHRSCASGERRLLLASLITTLGLLAAGASVATVAAGSGQGGLVLTAAHHVNGKPAKRKHRHHHHRPRHHHHRPAGLPTPVPPTPAPPKPVPPTSPAPAPPPAGTPAPSGSCAAYPSFPDASCTGWKHTGVSLKSVPATLSSGPGWHAEKVAGTEYVYITKPGAVLDGLDINACVKVNANNVTISRSRIRCNDYYLIRTSAPPVKYTGLKLTDVELDGLSDTSSTSIAVEEAANSTYTRLDVHGVTSSGPRIGSGDVVQDSYIHDIPCAKGNHTAGMSANSGGSNIVIRHNNIDLSNEGDCASASWAIYKDFGTYNGVLTEKNLFNGGSYCAYAAVHVDQDTRPAVSNIKFIDNVFGRKYTAQCGGYGPIAQYASGPGNEWKHNTWGGGAAATSAHRTGDPVVP